METATLRDGYPSHFQMPLGRSLLREDRDAAPAARELVEKRRLLLLVRVALTLGVACLVLYGNHHPAPWQLVLVPAFLASNVVVVLVPARILGTMAFDMGVVLVDTVVTSFAMYASPQAGTDILLLYFAIILMASVGDRLVLSLLACVVTSVAYFAFLLGHGNPAQMFEASVLLRFPFLLIVGAFYGFFVDRARRARTIAQRVAARQRARSEFLASLTADIRGPLEIAQRASRLLCDGLSSNGDDQKRRLAEQLRFNLRVVSDLVGLVPHEGSGSES